MKSSKVAFHNYQLNLNYYIDDGRPGNGIFLIGAILLATIVRKVSAELNVPTFLNYLYRTIS